jgi:hypothetical protein
MGFGRRGGLLLLGIGEGVERGEGMVNDTQFRCFVWRRGGTIV